MGACLKTLQRLRSCKRNFGAQIGLKIVHSACAGKICFELQGEINLRGHNSLAKTGRNFLAKTDRAVLSSPVAARRREMLVLGENVTMSRALSGQCLSFIAGMAGTADLNLVIYFFSCLELPFSSPPGALDGHLLAERKVPMRKTRIPKTSAQQKWTVQAS